MGVDWQQRKWRFVPEECPQQQNTDDCGDSVLLSAMHATANLALPPATILYGNPWRLLFTLLIRKSLLTPCEASSICFVDTSDPVTSEDLGHCQQLIRQLRTLKSTQRSLDRAKNLLVNFSGHSEALITATAPLTSYLSQTHHISESMHVRNCPDQDVFTMIQWTSMRLEDQVQSDKAHVAKVSDLNFLLAQADTLEMGCTRVRNTSYRRPKSCCLLRNWGLQSRPSILEMQARRRLSKLSGLLQWLSSCSTSVWFEVDQALFYVLALFCCCVLPAC
jgi:hypothetical protein